MLLIIIIVFIVFIVFTILWWYCTLPSHLASSSVDDKLNTHEDVVIDPSIPTMHSRCRTDVPCGGDLICDLNCRRCKKRVGGDCATDTDCESGLHCYDWKCTMDNLPEVSLLEASSLIHDKEITDKEVKWDDAKNEIRYI